MEPSQSPTRRLRPAFLIKIMPTFAVTKPTIFVLIDARLGSHDGSQSADQHNTLLSTSHLHFHVCVPVGTRSEDITDNWVIIT